MNDTLFRHLKGVKSLIALLVFAFCAEITISAQNTLNTKQLSIRNQIQSFLKNEGFQPIIDDDDDIKFKRQGDTYYVTVSHNDDDPFFVKLSKYYNYNETITRTKILLFNSGENDYKMCKVIPSNNYYVVKSEMFLTTASSFTNVFYRIIQIMDAVEAEIWKL